VFTLNVILEALTGSISPNAKGMINGAAIDSRQVCPNSIFIAIPGEQVDGHDFVADAFRRGASCAIIQKDSPLPFSILDLRNGKLPEEFDYSQTPFCIRVENSLGALQNIAAFWRQQLNLRVVGITGSVGKSTTKELVAEVLSQRFHTLKNPGNMNNEIGLPLTILQLTKEHNHAVLEMGFYVPGEISFLCEIAKPQIGVITNVGTVHAERAGSQTDIARGKSELVQSLPAAPEGVAILNYDDPWVRGMAEKTNASVFTYGLDPEADLWADNVVGMGLEGIRFQLHYKNEVLHVRVPLIGRHSVHTVLRATAVGLVEGLTWQEILNGMRESHMQLRLVVVQTPKKAIILDDTYNASPESTMAALNLLGDMTGNKIAVLGDMLELGIYEQTGHEMVGNRAAQICNKLFTVGPRAQMIASAAQKSGMPEENIFTIDDTDHAVEFLRNKFVEGDVVLIKGSHGLHMEQIVAALEEKE
jgi:UDP-N-acetylmuramoyl-tripeptide--D-alanyl-D-alanine ligase